MTRSMIASLAACGMIGVATARMPAQTVRGTLVDELTDQPIKGAEVSLVHTKGASVAQSMTDTGGHYVVTAPRSGTYYLNVRHLGYRPATSTQFPLDSETLLVGIRLELVSERLGTVRIVTEGLPPIDWTGGFAERRAKGIGTFRTVEDIARNAPQIATDAFRGFPGLEVVTSVDQMTGERHFTLSNSRGLRSMSSLCEPVLYVDGMQVSSNLNDAVTARELDKIEYYPSAQGVPAGYRPSSCGTLLIWTTRYTQK